MAVKREGRLPPGIAYVLVEEDFVGASSGGERRDESGEVHDWLCWVDAEVLGVKYGSQEQFEDEKTLDLGGKKLELYIDFASRLSSYP